MIISETKIGLSDLKNGRSWNYDLVAKEAGFDSEKQMLKFLSKENFEKGLVLKDMVKNLNLPYSFQTLSMRFRFQGVELLHQKQIPGRLIERYMVDNGLSEEKEVAILLKEKFSISQAAEMFRCSHDYIYSLFVKAGISGKNKKKSPVCAEYTDEEMLTCLKCGAKLTTADLPVNFTGDPISVRKCKTRCRRRITDTAYLDGIGHDLDDECMIMV